MHGSTRHDVTAVARLQVLLGEQLNTPNELFYVRHHLPVPHIKADDYRLTVEGAVQPTAWRRVKPALLQISSTPVCRHMLPKGDAGHDVGWSSGDSLHVVQPTGEGCRSVHLTLDELKSKFKKHTVAAALQCTGNRRHELKEIKEVQVHGPAVTCDTSQLTYRRRLLTFSGASC